MLGRGGGAHGMNVWLCCMQRWCAAAGQLAARSGTRARQHPPTCAHQHAHTCHTQPHPAPHSQHHTPNAAPPPSLPVVNAAGRNVPTRCVVLRPLGAPDTPPRAGRPLHVCVPGIPQLRVVHRHARLHARRHHAQQQVRRQRWQRQRWQRHNRGLLAPRGAAHRQLQLADERVAAVHAALAADSSNTQTAALGSASTPNAAHCE